ncbi:MAG TPA: DUF402 domain-containing protein [Anaerolineaceae bacterium]|nr:DUF402 domain-containing protein [Anaerolineaceae bacterium]
MTRAQLLKVEKYFANGAFSFSWQGQAQASPDHERHLTARFNGKPGPVGRVMLSKGDLFIETYYDNRWYNRFEIHSPGNPSPKIWYYNISRPAEFASNTVRWVDLALDVLIYPNGEAELLDLDEFGELEIDFEIQRQCWLAVLEILSFANRKKPSFEG